MTSQQPELESNSPAGISGGHPAPTILAIPTDKPSGPTLGTRLIIFSALVLPSALIPLFVLRRSVNNLHRKVDQLHGATRDLHHEFKSVMLELSIRREQHERLQGMIAETRKGLARLREETQRSGKERASEDERMRVQVRELVASDQYVHHYPHASFPPANDWTHVFLILLCDAELRTCVCGSWGHLSLTLPRLCKRSNSSRASSRIKLMEEALNDFGFSPCNLRGWVRLRLLMPM